MSGNSITCLNGLFVWTYWGCSPSLQEVALFDCINAGFVTSKFFLSLRANLAFDIGTLARSSNIKLEEQRIGIQVFHHLWVSGPWLRSGGTTVLKSFLVFLCVCVARVWLSGLCACIYWVHSYLHMTHKYQNLYMHNIVPF